MKKFNLFAVLAVSATFFLASCGSTATEQPAAETAPEVEEAAVVEEEEVAEEEVAEEAEEEVTEEATAE